MSVARGEKPSSIPERYVLGTPRIQLDLSRLASLGLPRRVPCGDCGQGSFPAESSNGNGDLPPFKEERLARCQDSVATSSLPSADSLEARKRKADRDAPICRERTLPRQEEGRIHPTSRSNIESGAGFRNHNPSKDLLHVQDKENINPFSDLCNHEPEKQVFDRSRDKPRLQVSKSSQNVPSGRKVGGSLLVKQSIRLKSTKNIDGGFQASFISQDGSTDRKQVHQINKACSKACFVVESIPCVQPHGQADSVMYILGDSLSNSQPLQVGRDVSVNSKGHNVSPSLQEQDVPKALSSLAHHADLQDMKGRSVSPESNGGVVLTSVKDLSSSMNSLSIVDTPQADGKRELLPISKNAQGSFISEKTHEANFAPAVPAACPSLPALSAPSTSAWSYTIRTGSAPAPTSHTVESAQSLSQQNTQPSSDDRSAVRFKGNCATAVSNEGQDVKQEERHSPVRPVLVEKEVVKPSRQRPFHDNLPISDKGAGKLIQHLSLPENQCIGGESSMQSRKQGENDHFVWVNRRRYQKLKKIGRGGSSEVFKVIDRDGNIYALKRIKLKGRDYATAYGFYQEIELLTKLQGKSYIIRLINHEVTEKGLFSDHFEALETVRQDAYIYMVLEYGEIDLAAMLQEKFKERGPGDNVDETWLRFYWRQILEAVNTVHEERIIHADLKPANFLLVKGVLKLIDFGIAKSIQGDTTNIQRDAQVGTINYMSPEAFMTNEKDEYGNVIKCGRPSDIWALGCILYQMVYGKTPFAHITALHSKIQEVANPNHKINFPPVSNPHLLDIMKKCLAYKREERFRIPELLNHPFLQPQLVQPMEAENLCKKCYINKVQGSLDGHDCLLATIKEVDVVSRIRSSQLKARHQPSLHSSTPNDSRTSSAIEEGAFDDNQRRQLAKMAVCGGATTGI
ncbi:hypothetical protein GOP47_0011706 [Adiantum capillus-veneris]|uniref:Protein kinase domain-containing protein n=1 Tax=Adiantum capillus-veneris TaxID=13818 RepID=A0A9D4UTA1_ADICA|nr:hypothetical protein GOP47_0011706 [Adiantum capillus-veneris]